MAAKRSGAARATGPARIPRVVTVPSVVIAPKQRRSEAMLQRIVAAARALFAEREFEQTTVADIAARAGVSVGLVYTRFQTKEHLLLHLARDVAVEMEAAVERAMDPGARGTRTPLAVSERYFALAATAFARHRGVLRPLTLIARLHRQHELGTIVRQFNARAHALLRDRLLEFRGAIRHADHRAAVETAIAAGSGILREALLYGDPVSVQRARAVGRSAARVCVAFLCWGPAR